MQRAIFLLSWGCVLSCGGRAATSSLAGGDGTAGGNTVENDAGVRSSCGGDLTGVTYTGEITLSFVPGSSVPFSVLGGFEAVPAVAEARCSVGACCYVQYGQFSLPDPGETPTAGALTITDGATPLITLPAGDYAQGSDFASSLRWAAGDTLALSASGADVAAFQASIVAPPQFANVVPAFSDSIAVSLSSDLVVSWTPGALPCAQASLSLSDGVNADISCTVDDSAGSITVPASLLGKFISPTGRAGLAHTKTVFARSTNANVEIDAITAQGVALTYQP